MRVRARGGTAYVVFIRSVLGSVGNFPVVVEGMPGDCRGTCSSFLWRVEERLRCVSLLIAFFFLLL